MVPSLTFDFIQIKEHLTNKPQNGIKNWSYEPQNSFFEFHICSKEPQKWLGCWMSCLLCGLVGGWWMDWVIESWWLVCSGLGGWMLGWLSGWWLAWVICGILDTFNPNWIILKSKHCIYNKMNNLQNYLIIKSINNKKYLSIDDIILHLRTFKNLFNLKSDRRWVTSIYFTCNLMHNLKLENKLVIIKFFYKLAHHSKAKPLKKLAQY